MSSLIHEINHSRHAHCSKCIVLGDSDRFLVSNIIAVEMFLGAANVLAFILIFCCSGRNEHIGRATQICVTLGTGEPSNQIRHSVWLQLVFQDHHFTCIQFMLASITTKADILLCFPNY